MNNGRNATSSRINIIIDLALLRGDEIKTIQQYHSAVQSLRMHGRTTMDILNYKPGEKHTYMSHFAKNKCGSC
jgi:hypothetical protein